MTFRYTLTHDILGSQVISEPDGWSGAVLKLERDMDLFSLIETFEGGANSAFIFYGNNGTENGGIDFIRSVETTYGFDANIEFLVEYAPDDVTFSTLFSGLLDLSAKNEMKDNKMQIPVIRDDFWVKFINRFETPVNISDLVDLDGNAVAPVGPVFINLTSQKLRQQFEAISSTPGYTEEDINVIVSGTYYQMSFDQASLEEIEEVFVLPQLDNAELPAPLIEILYGGVYSFEIQTVAHDYNPAYNFGIGEDLSDYIRFYININGQETEFAIGDLFTSVNIDGGRVYTLTLNNQVLEPGALIRVYGKAIANLTVGGGSYNGQIRWNGPVIGSSIGDIECFLNITADTVYPASEVQGYLVHDLFHAVCVRLGLGNDPFYSEYLGSTLTQTKQYDDDGCGWMYAIIKGLQLRQYTLAEKPFFISFKQLWEGMNPIFNLYCGYETVNGSQKIRIEQKTDVIGQTAPINFSNVREISSSYDKDFIFKTIRNGYKKWQAEDISGLDDPQTKHVYATRITHGGLEIPLESDFIAAGLAIEITRRKTREQSADYKFDNDNFIIALNTNDLSPDVYVPELDEGFSSVTNLINADTRYNLMLTPARNLYRWRDYLSGCLQSYLSSNFKFVSGEGNYDMTSDADTDLTCSRAVYFSSLQESDDIAPDSVNYLFLPELFNITIPMEKEEYDLIDRKQPIGISQSAAGHVDFQIKSLEYDLLKGEANILAWPATTFTITVPEQVMADPPCLTEEVTVTYDAGYQAILDYADTIC